MNQEEFKLPIRAKYFLKANPEGYVRLGDLERGDFGGRQVKNIAGLLDGEEGTSPEYNLPGKEGKKIRYEGKSGNYTDMKIHIDDIETFIELVKKHFNPTI